VLLSCQTVMHLALQDGHLLEDVEVIGGNYIYLYLHWQSAKT